MNAPTLYEYLSKKLEQKRNNHPSFRLMDIDANLFPNGLVTFDTETQDSNNQLKSLKEIVAESWEKKRQNHLIIVGEGGIGKTVTLLSLPDLYAPHYVPAIFIPLHELQGETSTIEKYIKDKILDYNDGEARYGKLMNVVGEPWDKGPRLLLLLDGFNEIANERRADISQDIELWSERPGVQIITSSRYDIRQYVALGANYSKIELQTLAPEKVTEYLHRIGYDVLANQTVMNLISTPLLLTLYIKTEKARIYRQSPLAEFRETQNAGSLIWNYLQSELWRFRGNQEETKACVLAMEFIAPYIAWNMQQQNALVLKEGVFLNWMEEAYKLLKDHFGDSAELPRHIKNTVRLTSRQLPEYELIRDLLKEQLGLFIRNDDGDGCQLMHRRFRDPLAAIHLINLSYLSGDSLPNEWVIPYDYQVIQYVENLISEEEATRLWEQNRKTAYAKDDATRNQLRLQSLLHNNDFSHLDFSGLDLSNISLYSYRFNKTTLKLPTLPIKMVKTKLSEKTFSAEGPKDWVDSIAVTPDGKRVICGSRDGIVCIWNLKTGELVMTLEEHKNWVKAIAVSPDGKRVISGSNDCTICIWDLETGTRINTLKGHLHWVTAVAVTPDGRRIVSGSFDKTICIWDLETGNNIMTLFGHEKGINAIAITPDGKHVISGSNDCTVRIWDLETGAAIGRPIEGHEDWVTAVAVAPDCKRIVSGSFDNTIRIWDLTAGCMIGEPIKGHEGSVNAVTITPDCKRIVSGSDDKTIRIWDLETGVQIGRPIEGHKDSVNAVVVTPEGKRIVSGSGDQTIRVWDLESGMPMVMSNEEHDLLSFEGLDFSLADISDPELKETLRQNGAKV